LMKLEGCIIDSGLKLARYWCRGVSRSVLDGYSMVRNMENLKSMKKYKK
jgi:hypothetical protein